MINLKIQSDQELSNLIKLLASKVFEPPDKFAFVKKKSE